MAVNEQGRQVAVAEEISERVRTLAHSTRDVPRPIDSYDLLGELTATTRSLEQVCRQLAAWHRSTVDGQHYRGEDSNDDGAPATIRAATALDEAARSLNHAEHAIRDAHNANGVIRWLET